MYQLVQRGNHTEIHFYPAVQKVIELESISQWGHWRSDHTIACWQPVGTIVSHTTRPS